MPSVPTLFVGLLIYGVRKMRKELLQKEVDTAICKQRLIEIANTNLGAGIYVFTG